MKEKNDNANENNVLIDDTMRSSAPNASDESINESLLLKNQSCSQKFINKIRIFPFIFYFLIIIFMLGLSIIIYYIYYCSTQKENFTEFKRDWISPSLDKRNYSIYLFDNKLEVMLIQDPFFDKDGGAIVIEKGYLDNPLEEGLSNYITHILSYYNFEDPNPKNIDILTNYYGDFKFEDEGDFIIFRFAVLNNGFKKFLRFFSAILDWKDLDDVLYSNISEEVINDLTKDYENNEHYVPKIENHLIEYLVYGFKNSSNEEILPEGNVEALRKIDLSKVKDYLEKLINPSKIKIVIFSKYKFYLSSKYMKHYFRYLIEKNDSSSETTDEFDENKNEERVFNKSQLIFMNLENDNNNYIKIIYYIDKVDDEDYPELYYKQAYFKYISDFINKKKDHSLYSSISDNIKSINTSVNVILKSKIQFTVELKLIDLKNITGIIYLTYQYIHKIINETDEENIQFDRYEELKNICRNAQNLVENSYDTMGLAKDNAKHLTLSKYAQKYYYFFDCVPWNDSLEYNKTILYNKTTPYLKQLRPENSIIILGIREKDRKNFTCVSKKFNISCEYLKNDSNFKETNYYKVKYKSIIFDSNELEKTLMNDTDNFNITFESNKFKSQYNNSCIKPDIPLMDINYTFIDINFIKNETLNIFHFKQNAKNCVQKVLLKFNLYHPFLRAKVDKISNRKFFYLLIMEIFTAIKRKIIEELSDAISAKNEISFGQTDNCLFIKVFCFSDQAYNISEKIKNILYETDWKNDTDFLENNYLYKNETFDEYFRFDKKNIQEMSRFYFRRFLKNNDLFNYYEFFPEDFEDKAYGQFIYFFNKPDIYKHFNSFAIEGYIYGYYTKEEADNLSKLFDINNIEEMKGALFLVNIKEEDVKDVYHYLSWTKKIKNLTENSTVSINAKIYNKAELGNYGISYRKFNESQLNISIFKNILLNLETNRNSLLERKDMIFYGDQYCELIFLEEDKTKIIPYEELVEREWNALLDNNETLNTEVDNIGNRYYYMIKNYIDLLKKDQASLQDRGFYEINLFDQSGIELNKTKIIEEYKDAYENKVISKDEFDNKIEYLRNHLNNYRVDVYIRDN